MIAIKCNEYYLPFPNNFLHKDYFIKDETTSRYLHRDGSWKPICHNEGIFKSREEAEPYVREYLKNLGSYKVLTATSICALEHIVNEHMKMNYKTVGGFFKVVDHAHDLHGLYYQAVEPSL